MSFSSIIEPLGVLKELQVVCVCVLYVFLTPCESELGPCCLGCKSKIHFSLLHHFKSSFHSCLVVLLFICLYYWFADCEASFVSVLKWTAIQIRFIHSLVVNCNQLCCFILRFSSWQTSRSTTWWRWHVISLFCFTRLDVCTSIAKTCAFKIVWAVILHLYIKIHTHLLVGI